MDSNLILVFFYFPFIFPFSYSPICCALHRMFYYYYHTLFLTYYSVISFLLCRLSDKHIWHHLKTRSQESAALYHSHFLLLFTIYNNNLTFVDTTRHRQIQITKTSAITSTLVCVAQIMKTNLLVTCFLELLFIKLVICSWESWWTYEGISGKISTLFSHLYFTLKIHSKVSSFRYPLSIQ